jgi:hypothetical protein
MTKTFSDGERTHQSGSAKTAGQETPRLSFKRLCV